MNKTLKDKIYRAEHKEERKAYMKRFEETHPWYKNYRAARKRCYSYAKYGRRGIQFLMTISDFEYLWYRDNANLMKRPTIDRKESDKDYTVINCRFIEFDLNVKLEKHVGWRKYKECSVCHTIKFRHNAHGVCISCYMAKYHRRNQR